jgi:AcrR family transcriptional regulator
MTQPAVNLATETDTSSRQRILAATAEVLGRNGKTKLSLSEVAAQARVSRPTLYRWFASKEELLSAFSSYERQVFESGLIKATAGLKGADRLDAVLRFIVEYQHSYSGVRMVDVEPEHTIASRFGTPPARTPRRGEGGDGDPDCHLALHRPQRRRRPVPRAATSRCGHQGD